MIRILIPIREIHHTLVEENKENIFKSSSFTIISPQESFETVFPKLKVAKIVSNLIKNEDMKISQICKIPILLVPY